MTQSSPSPANRLADIVARRRQDVAAAKLAVPQADLERAAAAQTPPRPFRPRLTDLAVIAEVKRRSPSAGAIAEAADPLAVAGAYRQAGAAAISVLTEPHGFGGSLDDLVQVRAALDIPVLRKDFLVDPYQIIEARAAGADALLLIVASLGSQLAMLLRETEALGMTALVEVHDEAEIEIAITAGATVIGINNRDLRDFTIDLATTERLRPLIPSGVTVIAESGIATPADMIRMRAARVDAVLIGSALMRSAEPGRTLAGLLAASRAGVAA